MAFRHRQSKTKSGGSGAVCVTFAPELPAGDQPLSDGLLAGAEAFRAFACDMARPTPHPLAFSMIGAPCEAVILARPGG